ncbi:MAG TPA: glutaredoxin domain-containing protein [Ramlibacter sp.]|jgi:glutaredoxin|uniref:glutaredoxin domain-containing protein n=1 Tax=Ramlibacter sp. TaxID=1917967 RepID=UPI002D6F76EF|nr:glutaredoxin domain-containing protein [Ramlibacter sp.]HZY20397.1 glutaredoxin domain-containing protein [Ramlibacter sp.]
MLAAGAALAQGRDTVYRSVGPDGRITYSQVPPAEGRTDRKLEFEHLPATPLPAYLRAFRDDLARGPAVPRASATAGLQLFSASWCVYCRQAKAWLAARGVGYQELDIDSPGGMAEFVRAGGKGGVPLLVGAQVRLQGFSESAYGAALGAPPGGR